MINAASPPSIPSASGRARRGTRSGAASAAAAWASSTRRSIGSATSGSPSRRCSTRTRRACTSSSREFRTLADVLASQPRAPARARRGRRRRGLLHDGARPWQGLPRPRAEAGHAARQPGDRHAHDRHGRAPRAQDDPGHTGRDHPTGPGAAHALAGRLREAPPRAAAARRGRAGAPHRGDPAPRHQAVQRARDRGGTSRHPRLRRRDRAERTRAHGATERRRSSAPSRTWPRSRPRARRPSRHRTGTASERCSTKPWWGTRPSAARRSTC